MNFLNNIDITFRIILFYTIFCLLPVMVVLIFGIEYFYLILITVLAGLVFLYFFIRSFIVPIQYLKERMKENIEADGDLKIIESIEYGDENGELFIEFNKMIKSIEKKLKSYDLRSENSVVMAQKKELKSNYYEVLYDITRIMLMVNNTSQLINQIITQANHLIESEVIIFQKYFPATNDFTIEGIKIFSQSYENIVGEIAIRGKKIPFEDSFGGYLINKKQIVSSEDIAEHDKFSNFKEFETLIKMYNFSIENFVGIPLIYKEEIIGNVIFINKSKGLFTLLDKKFTSSIFELLAYALKRQEIMEGYFIELQTGLFSYNYFYKRLKEELLMVKRHNNPSILVILSLDEFSSSTRFLDYSYNYILIEKLCNIIKNASRLVDVPALSGENEIAVLLPETGIRGGLIYAARLREQIEDTVFRTNQSDNIRMTASVGIYNMTQNQEDPEFAMESAREAMLAARKNGGNRIFSL